MTTPEWNLLKNLVGSPAPSDNEPVRKGWQFISFWGANMGMTFKAPSMESAISLLNKYGTIYTQDSGQTYHLSFDYEVKAGRLSSPQKIRMKIQDAALK